MCVKIYHILLLISQDLITFIENFTVGGEIVNASVGFL